MAQRLHAVSAQLSHSSPAPAPAASEPATCQFDTLIVGGLVYDPANGLSGSALDVAVRDGKIAALAPHGELPRSLAAAVYDATGELVMPGLVDLHAHGFQFFDAVGVDFDTACLCRCTTTAVDAGSSGAGNFPGFKKYVIERCQTRVLALLNISLIGAGIPPLDDPGKGGSSDDLAPVGGPYQSPAHLSVPHTVSVIEQNRDSIVGIKIALSKSTAAAYPGGPAAGEALFYEGALEASVVE
jgi:dihydroorotase